jgi:hypothetical protein
MISAWQIYWILQLDSLVSASVGLAISSGIVLIFSVVMYATNSAEGYESEYHCMGKKGIRLISPVFSVFFLVAALLPSSKTAAAMFIIPAIANNETIQKEAADLYSLAKQALTDAVKPAKSEEE